MVPAEQPQNLSRPHAQAIIVVISKAAIHGRFEHQLDASQPHRVG
jgi:hypothetical protein